MREKVSQIYRKSLIGEAYFYAISSMLAENLVTTTEAEELMDIFDLSIKEVFDRIKEESKNVNEHNTKKTKFGDGDTIIRQPRINITGKMVSFKNIFKVWSIQAKQLKIYINGKVMDRSESGYILAIEE